MTDFRTVTRILHISLCTVALAACGDSGNEPTATAATLTDPSNPDTDDNDDGNEGNEGNESNPTSTQPTGGAEQGGTEGQTSGQTTVGDTTGIDVTATGTGDTGVGETGPEMTTEPQPECGNGVQEGTEECDDGNQEDDDGCTVNCTITAVCGNGTVESGEVCDDGNVVDDDLCSADCQVATPEQVCGNGTVELPESCDDGNVVNGDGCESDCSVTPPECGNGKIEGDELCDDGNNVDGGPGDFCKNDCTVFVPASCNAPANYAVCDNAINLADKNDKTNAHKAMGICNGQPSDSVQITNFQFDAPDNASWQVAKGFGTYKFDNDMDPATPDKLLYSPREGDTFLIISTGVVAAPNAQGIVTEGNNSQGGNGPNNNPDLPDSMPAPLSDLVGSKNGVGGTPFIGCDGVHDCSDTLYNQWNVVATHNPNDKLFFRFNTKVPEGTFGYTFDFVFCSAEWPVYVNSQYNDMFVMWQTDPTPDDPMADPPVDAYTGNVTFVPDPNNPAQGLPLTITALDPYYDGPGYTVNEPQLAGTGFEQHACSDWFTAKGGVQPGADLNLGFFLTDMGDTALATVALVDNFRWDCKGCVPSEVDDCGIQQPQ